MPNRSARRRDEAAKKKESATNFDLLQGELPRRSDVQPEIVKTVIKLDSHSMVWARDEISSDVESLGPFFALLALFGMIYIVPIWILFVRDPSIGLGMRIGSSVASIPIIATCVFGVIYVLRISIFSRYSNIHFNRVSRKIYTGKNKLMLDLDWDRVRPFVQGMPGPLTMGGPPFWALELVEFSVDNSKTWTQRFRVQGVLPDRDACQRVWEAIRRYMDEPPEAMPEQEVVPGGRTWQGALVDFGPMTEVGIFDDLNIGLIGRLRKTRWIPMISPVRMFWWILFWPGPLSTILYARFRPMFRFPAEWTADEAAATNEPNPYRSRDRASDEVAGRRRAARIIGIVCGICIAAGLAWTVALCWWGVFPDIRDLWHEVLFGRQGRP